MNRQSNLLRTVRAALPEPLMVQATLPGLVALLLVVVMCFPVTSCVSSVARDVSPGRPKIARVGPALTAPCEKPALLPDKDLDSSSVARLWGKDRRALGTCGKRNQGLVKALTAIVEEQSQ